MGYFCFYIFVKTSTNSLSMAFWPTCNFSASLQAFILKYSLNWVETSNSFSISYLQFQSLVIVYFNSFTKQNKKWKKHANFHAFLYVDKSY